MSLREELIQVAAVAAAIVEDLDYGSAGYTPDEGGLRITETQQIESVLRDVQKERYRQNTKWGPQHHTPAEWLAILMEEVGEAAEEIDLQLDGSKRTMYMVFLLRCIQREGQRAKAYLDKYIFPKVDA